jgi:hypothetical protein
MSHDDFMLGYENGRVGCGVSAFLTLRLFLVGKIREKKVSGNLLLWLLGFLTVIVLSVVGFLKLPILWALLGTIVVLAIYALLLFYCIGDIVVSAALANPEFYELVVAKRALRIYSEAGNNAAEPQKVLHLRRAPFAQRLVRRVNPDARSAWKHPPTRDSQMTDRNKHK